MWNEALHKEKEQTFGFNQSSITFKKIIYVFIFSFPVFALFFALSLQKEYKRDLEQEVKGRGLSGVGLEETPELLRVRKANQILNQVN